MSKTITIPKNYTPNIAIQAAAGESGSGGGDLRNDGHAHSQLLPVDEEVELEVANLLKDLCRFVKERENTNSTTTCYCGPPPLTGCSSWGRKRRRSQPSSSSYAVNGGCSSSGGGGVEGRATDCPSSSTSPTSPLDFKLLSKAAAAATPTSYPVSSAFIVKPSSTAAMKRILRKEHDILTKERERLMGDFATIESHRDELIAQNQILKAKKQKLNSLSEDRLSPPNPNPLHSAAATEAEKQQFIHPIPNNQTIITNGGSGHGAADAASQVVICPSSVQLPTQFSNSNHSNHIQRANQTAAGQVVLLPPDFFQYPQMVGPTGIPDLNVSAEEYAAAAAAAAASIDFLPPPPQHHHHPYPLDLAESSSYHHHYRRISAKERRRNRVMMIQKRKNSAKLALGNT